jgi:hypothetical protein
MSAEFNETVSLLGLLHDLILILPHGKDRDAMQARLDQEVCRMAQVETALRALAPLEVET